MDKAPIIPNDKKKLVEMALVITKATVGNIIDIIRLFWISKYLFKKKPCTKYIRIPLIEHTITGIIIEIFEISGINF
tara:strand:- start:471 stop:701 length:231 start_codon:yes stop_codon:yes gene_type:complete